MKRMLLLLPMAFAAAVLSAETPIQVYKVQSSQPQSFATCVMPLTNCVAFS